MTLGQEPRTERTHGLKSVLDIGDRQALFNLMQMPGYEILLDLMEAACIQQETKLINAPVENAKLVLAEHTLSKAYWQVFVMVQKEVQYQVNEYLGFREKTAEPSQADWLQGTEG